MDQPLIHRQQFRRQADLLKLEQGARLVQQAQHQALAERRRHHRDANVDLAVAYPDGNSAVLRQPGFGNVQVGHDLEARDDARLQRLGRRQHLMQHAVDTVSHLERPFERLDVDVAGAVAHRLRQDQVDELDDGRLGLVIQDILRPFEVVCQAAQRLVVQILNDLVGRLRAGVVEAVQGADDFALAAENWLHRGFEEQADVVERLQIQRPADGHQRGAVLHADRHQPVLPRERQRHAVHQRHVELRIGQLPPNRSRRVVGPAPAAARRR